MKNCQCEGFCTCPPTESIKEINLQEQKRSQEDGLSPRMAKEIESIVRTEFGDILRCVAPLQESYKQGVRDGFKLGYDEGINDKDY